MISGLWQSHVLFNNLNDLIPLPKCTNEDGSLPELAKPLPHSTTAFYAQVCASCRTLVMNFSRLVPHPSRIYGQVVTNSFLHYARQFDIVYII